MSRKARVTLEKALGMHVKALPKDHHATISVPVRPGLSRASVRHVQASPLQMEDVLIDQVVMGVSRPGGSRGGKQLDELSVGTNWNYDIHWHPKILGLILASSSDANIIILREAIEATFKMLFTPRNPRKFSSKLVDWEISYNGYKLEEFVSLKTSAYVSQYDIHIPQMTVRETLDFSACCQGVGYRAEIMKEVISREKQEGIVPEPDLDTYEWNLTCKLRRSHVPRRTWDSVGLIVREGNSVSKFVVGQEVQTAYRYVVCGYSRSISFSQDLHYIAAGTMSEAADLSGNLSPFLEIFKSNSNRMNRSLLRPASLMLRGSIEFHMDMLDLQMKDSHLALLLADSSTAGSASRTPNP
ncbi:hypothetical protein Sjap_008386 [Stephania japonica]|uniref:Uncharacterized protein n=1 Tax=Stephania japonica TaxID=461633 RepID=A0AAP0JRT1_9MAGN